jgi:putative ATP-dependent endonuclease of OLD family
MTIKRLVIDNFRSIDHLELNLGSINALIGPNNVGKSNILTALNLVLGETWPSRPLPESDYHNYNNDDPDRPIEIKVTFDEPLLSDTSVRGFCLRYSPDQGPEYFPIDSAGDRCRYPGGNQKRISNQMRSERALLYLDLERQAERQIRATQWTLYGKLLAHIESTILLEHKRSFASEATTSFDAHVRSSLENAQTIIDEFVRRQTGLQVNLEFKTLDPSDVLKNVRPFVLDGSMSFDVVEVGAGVQSAVAIAIARAYASLVRTPLMLAVEEPELYLHPHGCRNFYHLLRTLAETENLQIVYTTHNRAFVDAGQFDAIHIVRKNACGTLVKSGSSISLPSSPRDRLRIHSKFNERVNEVFFASCVVLVEGPGDEVACRCALEAQGLDLDRQSISVIDVGGNSEVPPLAQVLVQFDTPTLALLDEDPGNTNTAAILTQTKEILSSVNLFIQRPKLEGIFGLRSKPSRVQAMSLFPGWFALNPVPQPYVDLANRIKSILN